MPPPMPPAKPAERGFGRGKYASDGQELAERDAALEQELYVADSTAINFDAYENIPAEATGNNVPPPVASFGDAGLHPQLMENIKLVKYSKPTPIQRFAIAAGLKNRDLMACAQTGACDTHTQPYGASTGTHTHTHTHTQTICVVVCMYGRLRS
jgi:hypothetical protein